MYSDTIAAIATPQGEGGIGTVRISGPDAGAILARIFMRAGGHTMEPSAWESHKIVFGHIVDPATERKVDEVLAVLMRAPHSYTREDVAEIDCHGGTAPMQAILALCLREGARMAEPGEFTLRAFLNGRLDLAQAEAVLDVVQARTGEGLRLAVEQLQGGLSARVRGVRAKLLHALAHLEANIDFPEDDVPTADVAPELSDALADLDALIAGAGTGIVLKQGVRTALVGRPNVGKSSLLNALLRADRAIVTPIPGTTRDTLEEVANVRGVPLVLVDTAGLRDETETSDPIEQIGMDRTVRALRVADLALLIFDGSHPLTSADRAVIGQANSASVPMRLAVLNKDDLPTEMDVSELRGLLDGADLVAASAVEQGGTDALEEKLAALVLSGHAVPNAGESLVTSVRHKDALERAHRHTGEALTLTGQVPAALTAVDLHSALNALGEITGETVGEDLLDEIFRNFCIGK